MSDARRTASSELTFTDADFRVISQHAARRYGLDIKIEKKGLIYARLARRIRALGLPDFKAYCDLATGPQAANEAEELLSALTTNVSSFFREKHHFEALKTSILPVLREKAERGGGIRIWSAGCSSGQEPYSIAATLKDVWPDMRPNSVSILATDVDPRILAKAKAATYRATEAGSLSSELRDKLFEAGHRTADMVKVRSDLRAMVSFDELNLVGNWKHAAPFDIIFCRNVVIYFERTTQHQLWQRFRDSLSGDGHLFIGHSERLTGPAETSFRNVGITAFQKAAP